VDRQLGQHYWPSPRWLEVNRKDINRIELGPLRRGDANDAYTYRFTTFWQYADSGPYPGDQDYFNGDMTGLHKYAFLFFIFVPCFLRMSLHRDMTLMCLCIGWHLVECV
jgi:hypothetical protein